MSDVDPSSFPALELTLDEARRIYEEEVDRRRNLETKASALIAAAGVLLTFIGTVNAISWIATTLVVVFVLGSLFLGLFALRIQGYEQPHGDPGDFYGYARLSEAEGRDKFLLNYIRVIEANTEESDKKVDWIRRSFISLLLSFLVLGMSILAESWGTIVEAICGA